MSAGWVCVCVCVCVCVEREIEGEHLCVISSSSLTVIMVHLQAYGCHGS